MTRSRRTDARRIRRRTVAQVAAGGAVALVGGCSRFRPATPAESEAPLRRQQIYQSVQIASRVLPVGKGAWVLWGGPGGSGSLQCVDQSGLAIESHPVTGLGEGTLTTQFTVAAGGAIWFSLNRTVGRASSGTCATWELEASPVGTLAGATDRTAPLAGTWITSIVALGEDVVVSRLNVPHLTRVTPQGRVSRFVEVPPDHVGARAMVGDGPSVTLAPGWLSSAGDAPVIVLDTASGEVRTNRQVRGVHRFVKDGDKVYALTPAEVYELDSGSVSEHTTSDPLTARWTSRGGQIAFYDRPGARVHLNGATQRQVQFELSKGLDSRPSGASAPPQTGEAVADLEFAEDGRLWVLHGDGRIISLVY